MEIEKRKNTIIKRKKICFAKNVKMPMEASMVCNIDGETFYFFTKNTLIGNSGTSCHITNDDTGLFDMTKISESIQGSSSSMPAGKLPINIY